MRQLFFFLVLSAPSFAATKPVDFNRDVRPILSDNCFKCHGPDEETRMAKLRLDTKEGAFALRGSVAVIVPGKPEESRLYLRISHAKKAMRMPPPAANLTLTDAQIDTVKRWIADGAKWETHWAYAPPKLPEVPAVSRKSWVRNPIDAFILSRLDREGLKASREAPKETLLRRVTLDLTGLPPTQEELEAFLKDKSSDAYEKVVDRLLASPHYGERMAMQWMDLARYADTHGYHIDSHRDMWPWRDWVIRAFNDNLSFDKFTIWQLAGDLLPNPTREQKIATGFNRNHMINFEGGAIPEEYQVEYMVDRIETTSNVWMGTTMGCARCHDHKYDPIRQRDFYRFGAFFNTIDEKGLDGQKGNAEPFLPLPNAEQEKRLAELQAALDERAEKLPDEGVWFLQLGWRKQHADIEPKSAVRGLSAWYELDGNLSDTSGHFRNGRLVKGEPAFNAGPVRRAADFDTSTEARFPADALALDKPFSVAFWFRVNRQPGLTLFEKKDATGGIEIKLGKPMTLRGLRRGHNLELRWTSPNGTLAVRSDGYEVLQSRHQHMVIASDGSGTASGISLFLNGKPVALITERDGLGKPAANAAPILLGSAKLPYRGRLDDLRFYERILTPEEIDRLAVHYPVEVMLATPTKPNKEQRGILEDYFLTWGAPPDMRAAYREWKDLKKEFDELEAVVPTTMVMAEMEKPRDTFVLARGDYRNQTEKVTPGVPSMLPPLPSGAPANRLTLAEWLVEPQHPLTARVTVNRFWQMYFGHGIVKTSEDFGSQGEPPVHPELLDWLATEFIRTGWDVKAMQRLIVTSSTYRQSSKVTPQLHERDPENRLLARGPRYRLPAEIVHDNALAVSGLLNDKIGGKSVLPYQPAGLWEELAFGEAFSAQEYVQSHGEDLYRRSMYTFWKRTAPPASLNTFDAPDREKCTSRRAVTNTPLQALVTLNDPTYVEAARHLAVRVLKDTPKAKDDARLKEAFRLVTARAPSKEELRVLRDSLKVQEQTYAHDEKSADSLLKIGESPVEKGLDEPTLAAWTNVCTILLNLDETITKE